MCANPERGVRAAECIFCGHASVEPVFSVRSFTITRCSSCGHGRTLVEEGFDFEAYYSAAYFHGGMNDGYADYTGCEATLRVEFKETLAHLLKRHHRRGSLLEFGCAYGFFLREAARHFDQVEGIDLSADAVRFCKAQGLSVTGGVVEDTTLRGPYDVAVGLDVIEHVPEPQETVRLISERLKPGGMLLLTTGDWGSLVARVMGKRWRLMTPPQHLSFFTEASMRLLLERWGLRVLELSHPLKRVPLSLVAYQLQRLVGLKALRIPALNSVTLPITMGDSMRVLAVK